MEEDNDMVSQVEQALWGEVQKLNSGVLRNMERKPRELIGARIYFDKVWCGWRLLSVWK
jgi:hypothetical protein